MIGVGEPVLRRRPIFDDPPEVDRYGNEIPSDWDDITVDRCALAPRESTDENGPGRAAIVVGQTLYAPSGADIAARDLIVARGVTYEIDGDIADWRNPSMFTQGGLVIQLTKVTG